MNKSGFVIVDTGLHAVGLNDKDGKEVLPCVYDKILDYDDDGYVRFIKDGVYGTVDLSGNIVIPLTVGLTHLGVFYNGTARAQKNHEKWGLVDEHGNDVGEFCYRQINAHYGKGYKAFLSDNTVGFLAEDGTFTSYERKVRPKPRYSIHPYRNGVAPAYQEKLGWVFIDRDENRINDIVYSSMDPVLRNGVYYVSKGAGKYGACRYDGTPIVDKWFTHPLKFDKNGFSECHQLYLDENGKEVLEFGGQPRFNYGILKIDGTFLFPMVYSNIHWNNYTTRDCWFAEDDRACFLLFPDGSRRIYRKNSAVRAGYHLHIPLDEYDNNISEEMYAGEYRPREILIKHYYRFNKAAFLNALATLHWWGVRYDKTVTVFDAPQLKFYYRDTDAEIDRDFYKVGRVLRAGYFMDSTEKLLRPVHKTRFVIATSLDLSKANFVWESVNPDKLPYQGNVIHCNACFVVLDVYEYFGVTQILLLHLPYAAIALANKYRLDIASSALRTIHFDSIKQFVRDDLETNMGKMIHGHSLSDYWVKAMHHPIGMSRDMTPVHLKQHRKYKNLTGTENERYFYECYDKILHNEEDRNWTPHFYDKLENNVIKIVVGDISKLSVGVVVTATSAFPGLRAGRSKIVEATDRPCSMLVYTVGPTWQGGSRSEARVLKSCYSTALKLASSNRLYSIAFPAVVARGEFPLKEAAQIAFTVIMENIRYMRYMGDVIICCDNDEEAQIYNDVLQNMMSRFYTFPCV